MRNRVKSWEPRGAAEAFGAEIMSKREREEANQCLIT